MSYQCDIILKFKDIYSLNELNGMKTNQVIDNRYIDYQINFKNKPHCFRERWVEIDSI